MASAGGAGGSRPAGGGAAVVLLSRRGGWVLASAPNVGGFTPASRSDASRLAPLRFVISAALRSGRLLRVQLEQMRDDLLFVPAEIYPVRRFYRTVESLVRR